MLTGNKKVLLSPKKKIIIASGGAVSATVGTIPAAQHPAYSVNPRTWTAADFTGCVTGNIAGVFLISGAARTFTSVTIGGIAATLGVAASSAIAFFYVTKFNASSADVVVTYNAAPDYDCMIPVVIKGANAATLTTAFKNPDAVPDPQKMASAFAIPTNGVGIVSHVTNQGTFQTATWTNCDTVAGYTSTNAGALQQILNKKTGATPSWDPQVSGNGGGFGYSQDAIVAIAVGP